MASIEEALGIRASSSLSNIAGPKNLLYQYIRVKNNVGRLFLLVEVSKADVRTFLPQTEGVLGGISDLSNLVSQIGFAVVYEGL